MEFGISTEIGAHHEFEQIEVVLRELLAAEGFGILTEIDVQAVMKKKLDLDKRPYKILGACNPPRANTVLDVDPEMGIFLPCNVIMYETETGSTIVSATNASAMFTMINNPDVEPVANEVTEIFKTVISQMEATFF